MGPARSIVLTAQPLTEAAWAPFGCLPSDEGTAGDRADLEFLLGDGHVNFIGHTFDEIGHDAAGAARCDHLNRHDTHTQTLMPVNADAVVVVAPAALDLHRPEHLDAVRAFVLRPLDAIHLARGTWHWGPFPVTPGTLRLFNIQGRGYPQDNTVASLPALYGLDLAVALPPNFA
jgi:ureidoglycolate hydrolase